MNKALAFIFFSFMNASILSGNVSLQNIHNDMHSMAPASVSSAEWRSSLGLSVSQVSACDNVRLMIRTSGYPNGSKFKAKIYKYDSEASRNFVTEVTITISFLSTGYATWTAQWINDEDGYATYIFEVYDESGSTLLGTSGFLKVYDDSNPSPVNLTLPVDRTNFTGTSSNISFSWQNVLEGTCQSPIDLYRIEVSKTSDFSSLEWSQELKGTYTSHQFNNGNYYWRVAAKDIAGNPATFANADWSAVYAFKIGESKFITRINAGSFTDKQCVLETTSLLSAILEYYDEWELKWLPLENKSITFQININDEWHYITDEISTTASQTDSNGEESVYFIPKRDIPLGNYQIIAGYSGDESYLECSAAATLSIVKSYSEPVKLVYPTTPTSSKTPIILVHGDFAETSTSNCAWDTMLAFIKRSKDTFENYDVYLWKQDTSIPIGFNGITGSAKELSEFIQPILAAHPGKKVILIGHSRGGLVCRSYMNYNNQGDNVLGLITLGTPHHGAPMAVIDWSLFVFNNQYPDLPTNLIDIQMPAFDMMRIGDLNLRWDNMDSVIVKPVSVNLSPSLFGEGLIMLTDRDFNMISRTRDNTVQYSDGIKYDFGNLTELNTNEKYFDKIIAYGTYDNYLGDNGNLLSMITQLPSLLNLNMNNVDMSKLHEPIKLLTDLLSKYTQGFQSRNVNFLANDGLVPLQSALFTDISGGIPFSDINVGMVKLKNIEERKQVKSHRIFSNNDGLSDHIHLIDIPTRNKYWQTLAGDINSFYELEVTLPDANEWNANDLKTISWSSQNIHGNVDILLSTDNGQSYPYTLASNTANDNSEEITVPNYGSMACKIKIVQSDDTSKFAVNNGNFTITPSARPKGDVDNNGYVQAIDASLILQYVVGIVDKPVAGSEDSLMCDIDRNGMIGAYDAYLLLYFVVNGSYPENISPKSVTAENIYMGKISIEDDVLKIPLIAGASENISSINLNLNIDEKNYIIKNISSELPKDWLMTYNSQGSKLNIAMVGFSPLKKGLISEITLTLKSKSAYGKITGSAIINDLFEAQLSGSDVKPIPEKFELYQNYPNPFNPVTKIKYDIPAVNGNEVQTIELKVFDILGNEVATLVNKKQSAGSYEVNFDGSNLSSGIYLFRLKGNSFTSVRKMILTK